MSSHEGRDAGGSRRSRAGDGSRGSEDGSRAGDSARVNIKICGIARPQDAVFARDLGADFLGLIFVESSPRCVSLEDAEAIVDAVRRHDNADAVPKIVGVFKDADESTILAAVHRLDLDYVQCHGSEPPELLKNIPVPVLKAVEIEARSNLLEKISVYADCGVIYLFDKPKARETDAGRESDAVLSGSSARQSEALDWLGTAMEKLLGIEEELPAPFFLAGGLTPENVGNAVARLMPFGVDVASGVEASPRAKDRQKMESFINAVRTAEAAASKSAIASKRDTPSKRDAVNQKHGGHVK